MSTIDLKTLLRTLRGYAEVNEITRAERRTHLQTISRTEGWAIFAQLYETWQRTGQLAGGDQAALEQQHLEEKHTLRRAFEKLARHKGLL